MAALAIHYYAVLVWLALAVGEIARTRVRGRLDWPVWIALVIGLLVAPSFAQGDDADKAKEQPAAQTSEESNDLRESPSDAEGSSDSEGQKGQAGQRIEDVSLNLTLQSARIELTNLDDAEDEFVVYRFAADAYSTARDERLIGDGGPIPELAVPAGAGLAVLLVCFLLSFARPAWLPWLTRCVVAACAGVAVLLAVDRRPHHRLEDLPDGPHQSHCRAAPRPHRPQWAACIRRCAGPVCAPGGQSRAAIPGARLHHRRSV